MSSLGFSGAVNRRAVQTPDAEAGQGAQDGDLLDHFRALGLVFGQQRARGLRVVDGHAGEQDQADGADDLGHAVDLHEGEHDLR